MSDREAEKRIETEEPEVRSVAHEEQEKEGSPRGEEPRSAKRGGKEKVKRVEDMTKQELVTKVREVEEEVQKNYDLYMRAYAEMENVKRRGIKEREELRKYANESLIKELLPVIDNLQKAISHARNDENPSGLVEGLELTLDGLMKTLEKAGLKQVEADGKPFDPNFHEAISQQQDEGTPPGHVLTEFQKGYLLNGRLIRPAMVVVSRGNTNKTEGTA